MNVSVSPGFAAFSAAYEQGRGSLVWRRGVADLETPVAAFLKLAHGQPYSFLLESVEGADRWGRYSFIGTDPSRIQWRPAGEQLRSLLDQWKEAQRTGPRLDRPTECSFRNPFGSDRRDPKLTRAEQEES